jgi:hypothetical protein
MSRTIRSMNAEQQEEEYHPGTSLPDFLFARGHEMMPKGKHHDCSNEHDQETEGADMPGSACPLLDERIWAVWPT